MYAAFYGQAPCGGIETGGSGGSMNWGPRAPGGIEWGPQKIGKKIIGLLLKNA